jgi:AraC-like DNA-binding protein
MTHINKRESGFDGEKFISIPQRILRKAVVNYPELFKIYITHIGYFPRATAHFRERKKGCEDNILIYCLEGRGFFILGDKKIAVIANSYIIVPANTFYMSYWADGHNPWTIYWVHFTGVHIKDFNKELSLTIDKGAQEIPFNLNIINTWNIMYNSLEMGYSFENLCNANLCLHQLVSSLIFSDKHLYVEKEGHKNIINDTIHFMKNHIDKMITVDEMARLHDLSSSHFSSLFRKNTGIAPINYFIHLKMQTACQLLYSTNEKIKDIASRLGYDDQYYFSRIFKRQMNVSPENYRLATKKEIM